MKNKGFTLIELLVVISIIALLVSILMPALGHESVSATLALSKSLRGWFFCLAFVSIGLESNFRELASQLVGGKPIYLYIVGQSFNLILTLLMAWIAFGGIVFPAITE